MGDIGLILQITMPIEYDQRFRSSFPLGTYDWLRFRSKTESFVTLRYYIHGHALTEPQVKVLMNYSEQIHRLGRTMNHQMYFSEPLPMGGLKAVAGQRRTDPYLQSMPPVRRSAIADQDTEPSIDTRPVLRIIQGRKR